MTRTDVYIQFDRQGKTWHDLRVALTSELTAASTVLGFFPALNIVADSFIELIRRQRVGYKVTGFEELAYKMGLESKIYPSSMEFYRFYPSLYRSRSRYLHFDPRSTSRFLETRLEQRACDATGGSCQDTLHRLAGCLLRIAALEIVTNLCVQTADRERGHYIQVCLDRYRTDGSKIRCNGVFDESYYTTNAMNFQYHFGDRRNHYTGETGRCQRRVGRGHFPIHPETEESRYTGQESSHCRFHSGWYTHGTQNIYSNHSRSYFTYRSFHDLSPQLGNTLVFLFDLIGRNPAVQTKLYEETYALAPAGCDLTIDNLRRAKYLRACITESLRCVTHFNTRSFNFLILIFLSVQIDPNDNLHRTHLGRAYRT